MSNQTEAETKADLFLSIAATWEDRPHRLSDVAGQVKTIHDKLIEWGWKNVDREELDHATVQYSKACSFHECCQWLPFDVLGDWESDLFCLLMDEDRWLECVRKNGYASDLAETMRREMELENET